MSTLPTPRRPGRLIPWLAHHVPYLLIVAGVSFFIPLEGAIGWGAGLLGAFAFGLAIGAQAAHAYNYLCLRCAQATPLDGQAEATRRQRALAALHWLKDGRRGLAIGWVTTGMFFAPALVGLTFGKVPGLWIASLTAFAYWIVESFLYLRHLPVEPWCPQCHWDDGGDEEESPIIPDPGAPEGVR